MAQTSLNSTGVASSGSLVLQTNGTTSALTLDTAQNMGLGVTPSAWSAYKAIDLLGGGSVISFGNTAQLVSNYYYNGTNNIYKATAGAAGFVVGAGSFSWFNAPSGTAGSTVTLTQAMTLDASGQLGIGSTSPDGKFVVLGTAGSNPYSHFKDASGADFFIQSVGNSDCRTGTASNHPWLMFTNGTERARIDSSGNLLVGSTSVVGSGLVNISYAGATKWGIGLQPTGTDNASAIVFRNTSNGIVGSIGVTAVATLYNTSSDYRLKTVIGSVSGAGERIDALEPIEYEWKVDGSRTRGFLAHKFQEVYAGSVSGTKDAVDAEGNPVYQSMQASSSEVIADLVAEIQSLRQRVASLEA